MSPDTLAWLQTLITAVIGALVGGGVSTIMASRLDQRRWYREDVVYWRTEKRRAYAATLVNLIEARDGLLRLLRVDNEHHADVAEVMRALSDRVAPVNFETRMIASTAVETGFRRAGDRARHLTRWILTRSYTSTTIT